MHSQFDLALNIRTYPWVPLAVSLIVFVLALDLARILPLALALVLAHVLAHIDPARNSDLGIDLDIHPDNRLGLDLGLGLVHIHILLPVPGTQVQISDLVAQVKVNEVSRH